jgi:hypothetical protein
MYTLIDTFNKCELSRHRTLKAAVAAEFKMARLIKRAHGKSCYLPMRILANGKPLSEDQQDEAYFDYSN